MHKFDSHTLDDWLEYIQGIHFRSIDLSLDRVRHVVEELQFEQAFITIVVAGTNGKGSSVAYLESIYRTAGYKTGIYTSPHLVRYNERVRLNNVPVDDAELIQAFRRVEIARKDIPLTYFEYGTLAAMCVFEQASPSVCILEVGMGGRLDAVNAFEHDLSLITEIGLDHQAWLGTTIEQIASEKAGIIHAGKPVVGSGLRPVPIIGLRASELHSDYVQLGEQYGYEVDRSHWSWMPLCDWSSPVLPVKDLHLPNGGKHQLQNAAGVIAVIRQLETRIAVSDQHIREGLYCRVLPARCEVLPTQPKVILDVSHNIDGLQALNQFLSDKISAQRVVAVFSMLKDKDCIEAIREIYNAIDCWVITSVDSERSQSTDELGNVLSSIGTTPVIKAEDPQSAIQMAQKEVSDDDCIVAFGSFYLVGDIMNVLDIKPYPEH